MYEKIMDFTFKNYKSEMHLEWVLLLARMITIIVWTILLVKHLNVHIIWQFLFVGIIFISDAFDGIISRRFSTEKSQYFFRISDAVVDKLGILLFMLILVWLGRANIYVIILILVYNLLLVVFPIMQIFKNKNRQIGKIQATFYSRLYAVCVGLYVFFSLNITMSFQAQCFCLIIFLILSCLSFYSHIKKIIILKKGEE